jgi:hypothetical protein
LTVRGTFNYTVATCVLAGTPEMGGQPLFDAQAVTALTNQLPRIVLNFGAHYSVSEYYVDLREIIYGNRHRRDHEPGARCQPERETDAGHRRQQSL